MPATRERTPVNPLEEEPRVLASVDVPMLPKLPCGATSARHAPQLIVSLRTPMFAVKTTSE
jgi:hypothetical protein